MMSDDLQLPPISYIFFEDGQPRDAAWKELLALAQDWNQTHSSQLSTSDEGDLKLLEIVLRGGYRDPERSELERVLAQAERLHGCVGHRGIVSAYRGASDYENADFVHVIGTGVAPGFVTNFAALGPCLPCPECHRAGRETDREHKAPLCIDEAFLRKCLIESSLPAPDFINFDGGLRLVSKRFVDCLVAYGARGYELHALVDGESGQPSINYFLLGATRSVVTPCPIHTPTAVLPCSACGRGGDRLGERYVEHEAVRGLDVVSRHRSGVAELYFARELFASLRTAGLEAFHATGALDRCQHQRAAPLQPRPRGPNPTPPPRASVAEFLAYIRTPNPEAHVCRRGANEGPERAMPMEHWLAPPASDSELDELERRFPAVAHLRPLAVQADGISLFNELGSHDAFRKLGEARMHPTSALRIEGASDWPNLREEMRAWASELDHPLIPIDGLPFATIPASSDLLVCAKGQIYYVSPLCNRGHNQVVARNLEEFLALVMTDLANFLMESASVMTYYDEAGDQWYPKRYGHALVS